jgi:type IV pilus assembly protein PilY1
LASVKYDSTIVGVNLIYIDGVPKVEIVTSTNPTPELDPNAAFKPVVAGFTGKRVTWRELIP